MRSKYRDVLDSPSTRLVSGNTVEWRGRPHRELVLDTVMPPADGDGTINRRYGLFVRPERPGVVCGTRIYDPADKTQWLLEEVIEYQPGDTPLPAIKTIEVYATDKTSGYEPWRVQRYEVTEYTRLPAPVPEREFTLTAFGLPEPKTIPAWTETFSSPPSGNINYVQPEPVAPEAGPRYWLWALVVVLLATAAGAVYAWFRRSRNP